MRKRYIYTYIHICLHFMYFMQTYDYYLNSKISIYNFKTNILSRPSKIHIGLVLFCKGCVANMQSEGVCRVSYACLLERKPQAIPKNSPFEQCLQSVYHCHCWFPMVFFDGMWIKNDFGETWKPYADCLLFVVCAKWLKLTCSFIQLLFFSSSCSALQLLQISCECYVCQEVKQAVWLGLFSCGICSCIHLGVSLSNNICFVIVKFTCTNNLFGGSSTASSSSATSW